MRGRAAEIRIVFGEETRRNLSSGAYLIFTLAIPVLLVAGIWLVPVIVDIFQDDEPAAVVGFERLGFVDNSGMFADLEGETGPSRYQDVDAGVAAVRNDEIDSFFVIPADYPENREIDQYHRFTGVFGFGGEEGRFNAALTGSIVGEQLDSETLSLAFNPAFYRNLDVQADGSIEEPDPTAVRVGEFIVPLLFIGLLAISIQVGVGSMVQSVSDEKENKLVELVITSISPLSVVMGKLLSLGAIGLVQAAVWVIAAFITVPLMFDGIEDAGDLTVSVGTGAALLGSFIAAYFLSIVLGIFVGAVSSSARAASRNAPLIALVPWIPLWLLGLLINQPDGTVIKALTYFPFTAGPAIMMRLAVGSEITGTEIILSLTGVVVLGLAMLWVSARIFRAAILMSGQSFTMRHLIAALRHAD